MRSLLTLAVSTWLLTSCSFAPKYERPFMPVPEHFKETGRWVPAKPVAPTAKLSPWWESFHDAELNKLEAHLAMGNQDLRLALFRYEEARALVQVAQSRYFPQVQGIANADRQKTSETVANPGSTRLFNNVLVGANISYELDVWGSIRNAVAANKNLAQASAADLRAVSISLHAELATNYFSLRHCDEAQRILDRTVQAYTRALDLTKRRYRGGVSPIVDVDNAEAQLENARTMAADMRLQRAQYEHAIAVLIGEIPSNFGLATGKLPRELIHVGAVIPSTLLERRPDVAAAEFRVQAANAKIGVARAAFFPELNLSGVIGFQSRTLSNLLSKPSLFWSLGPVTALAISQPVVSQTLFDGGNLRGLLNQANAQYYQTVVSYRQTVLKAFQEVENSLVGVRQLDQQIRSQSAAARAARRALVQANNRYAGGIITFLEVVVSENIALQSELAAVNTISRRRIASVQLIKALGGDLVTPQFRS